jgi:hypothetical protein
MYFYVVAGDATRGSEHPICGSGADKLLVSVPQLHIVRAKNDMVRACRALYLSSRHYQPFSEKLKGERGWDLRKLRAAGAMAPEHRGRPGIRSVFITRESHSFIRSLATATVCAARPVRFLKLIPLGKSR